MSQLNIPPLEPHDNNRPLRRRPRKNRNKSEKSSKIFNAKDQHNKSSESEIKSESNEEESMCTEFPSLKNIGTNLVTNPNFNMNGKQRLIDITGHRLEEFCFIGKKKDFFQHITDKKCKIPEIVFECKWHKKNENTMQRWESIQQTFIFTQYCLKHELNTDQTKAMIEILGEQQFKQIMRNLATYGSPLDRKRLRILFHTHLINFSFADTNKNKNKNEKKIENDTDESSENNEMSDSAGAEINLSEQESSVTDSSDSSDATMESNESKYILEVLRFKEKFGKLYLQIRYSDNTEKLQNCLKIIENKKVKNYVKGMCEARKETDELVCCIKSMTPSNVRNLFLNATNRFEKKAMNDILICPNSAKEYKILQIKQTEQQIMDIMAEMRQTKKTEIWDKAFQYTQKWNEIDLQCIEDLNKHYTEMLKILEWWQKHTIIIKQKKKNL